MEDEQIDATIDVPQDETHNRKKQGNCATRKQVRGHESK